MQVLLRVDFLLNLPLKLSAFLYTPLEGYFGRNTKRTSASERYGSLHPSFVSSRFIFFVNGRIHRNEGPTRLEPIPFVCVVMHQPLISISSRSSILNCNESLLNKNNYLAISVIPACFRFVKFSWYFKVDQLLKVNFCAFCKNAEFLNLPEVKAD